MFFSLLFYEFSCTYQYQNNLGAELFSQEMNEGEKLCINISYYPSFVVFDDFEKDTLFSIFTHSPLADSPQSVKSTYIRYLNNYVPILDPFVQIVFESESPVNLSFTLLSLPGMCNDGIYFTTKTNENYILSTEESGFNKISPFHDKCIFKSVTDETNVTMSYSTDSHWSQAFVYESYDRYYSIGNNETHAFSTTDPYFYRIIVGEHSYYNQLSISFESPDDSEGYMPRDDYFYFEEISNTCNDENTWVNNEIAIVCLTIFIVLLLTVFLWLTKLCFEKNVKTSKKRFFSPDSLSMSTSVDDSLFTSISTLYQ